MLKSLLAVHAAVVVVPFDRSPPPPRAPWRPQRSHRSINDIPGCLRDEFELGATGLGGFVGVGSV